MSFKLKYFFIYFVFSVINKKYISCLDELINSNESENKIYLNFISEDKNYGCTNSVERDLINGKKFLKSSDLNEKLKINNRSFFSVKNSFHKEFLIYFFKSSDKLISNDFYKILFDCAESSSAKPYLVDICVKKYFKKYNIDFSSTCLSCFTEFIGCTFISCNKQCSLDQCSSECKTCSDKNCFKKLLSCTKLDKLPDPCK
ncbi:conserved Plasmodium protein, unknown function [Plasmodium relictum]|uniref:Uncharacterized protein n=1 Tax=Plasmodium relictum TaxID=85471 RepID=A0A1J1H069_PLARL|nr:conserved Plasmodium protein, unknown function [Plasmodium relictum]CRG98367.1 conserved Plasmodium protein, unknown function [Plasmodium relictum]